MFCYRHLSRLRQALKLHAEPTPPAAHISSFLLLEPDVLAGWPSSPCWVSHIYPRLQWFFHSFEDTYLALPYVIGCIFQEEEERKGWYGRGGQAGDLGTQWFPLRRFQVPSAQSSLKITEVPNWTNCVSLEQWLANYSLGARSIMCINHSILTIIVTSVWNFNIILLAK